MLSVPSTSSNRRDRPAECILRARRPIPRGAPEGDGDPNNSATSAESFSARIRRRRRAAVEGSIAGDERTWIDLDEIVELEISGVTRKTYLSFLRGIKFRWRRCSW